jgi:uncharacterized protein YndB with AHSA1/START domain
MLKKVLIGLVALVAVVVLVGFLLPSSVHVERSTTIQAPPDAVFPYVADYRKFNDWSPWAKLDPKTEYTITGEPGTVGAKMAWKSNDPNVGSGSQTLKKVEPPSRIETELDFGEHGVAQAFFALEAAGGGTKITWGFDSDMGMNPIGRWFGLMMDGMIGGDYEKGLANLKSVVEGGGAGGAPAGSP